MRPVDPASLPAVAGELSLPRDLSPATCYVVIIPCCQLKNVSAISFEGRGLLKLHFNYNRQDHGVAVGAAEEETLERVDD